MLPKLQFFGLTISTYYSMMFLGFVLMQVLMVKRKSLYHLNTVQAVLFAVCVMCSGLAGCKVLYIFENWGDPITVGGFSFFGAVFLVPLLMMLFGLLFRLRPGQSVSASAPCVCAMIGTIRVGCFLNGCCGGWTTATGFTWPTQAIESIGDFIILFVLLHKEEKGETCIYPLFMLYYGILRFLVEFLRDTSKDWMGMSHGQWFALISIAFALVQLYVRRNRIGQAKTKE